MATDLNLCDTSCNCVKLRWKVKGHGWIYQPQTVATTMKMLDKNIHTSRSIYKRSEVCLSRIVSAATKSGPEPQTLVLWT